MNSFLCGTQLHNSSSTDLQVEDPLYSALITNIVINGFLCYTTIMMNIVTIHALRKTSSLPKPLKTLLLSLAVSDLGVGLLGQPLYIARRVAQLRCNFYKLRTPFSVVANILFLSSLFGIAALSADRFVSIWRPLRYQELVTHQRVVNVVVAIWLSSAFLGLINMFVLTEKISFVIFFIIEFLCFVATTWFSLKVYLTVRRHNIQIQAQTQQVTLNSRTVYNARVRKSAQSTYWIYLVFLVCYLPQFFVRCFRHLTRPHQKDILITLLVSSWTLVHLNSALNPVIYCWKMRRIRRTVIDILRNIIQR